MESKVARGFHMSRSKIGEHWDHGVSVSLIE